METLSELDDLITRYTAHTKIALDRGDLENTLQHEGEHADIIRQLGGSATFALEVFANRDEGRTFWAPSTVPHNFHTTKIGAALVRVYPAEPPDSDMHTVRAVGYRDVQHVGDVADVHGLPRPLSDPRRK